MLERYFTAYLVGLLLTVLLSPCLAGLDAALTHHWSLDEAGPPYIDRVGGANATCTNCPQSVEGVRGGALLFDGVNDEVLARADDKWDWGAQDSFTMAYWTRATPGQASQSNNMVALARQGTGSNQLHWWIGCQVNTWYAYFQLRDKNRAGNMIVGKTALNDGEWHLLVCVRDESLNQNRLYVDTRLEGTLSWDYTAGFDSDDPFTIGHIILSGHNYRYPAVIDEVMVWERALTESDIRQVYVGSPGLAVDPFPPDAGIDVPRDVALRWTPGEFASTHNVYFGPSFDGVHSASASEQMGVLLHQGLDVHTCDFGQLEFNTTYHWRVDEVNGPPDYTVFKGDVWSFSTEPYSYPVIPMKATASSAQAGMGPEKTIDGSGLTGDQHGTEPTSMWMTAGAPPTWIQYEFDQVYQLHDLKVWNSNQLIESYIGFGAKSVAVEYSVDGTTWMALAQVPEFAKATGAGYAANTTVSFGGVMAKYVKLTINSTWGGMPTTGLSEVRFSYVPVQARAPQPVDGATGVSVETTLDWRPGREATSHHLFFGTDRDALTVAQTLTKHGYLPGPLDLGTTYYWKVDEVGAATYPGEVWSFATQEYQTVDDFESYTDKAGAEVFSAWVDGFDAPTKNGALVGLDTAVNGTFCDTTTFYGGRKSMPFAYDNVKAPLSEAARTFAPAQDWTVSGIKTLVLYFYGDAANTATELYIKINGTKITYTGKASDVARKRWNQWNVDLTGLPAATLRSVRTLTIGVTGGAGKLLIDEVRLYRVAPEVPAVVNPGTTGLVAYYALNNNVQDGSSNGLHGTLVGAPTYAAGLSAFGTALKLNGTTDAVDLGNKPAFNFAGSFSLSVWANIEAWTSNWNHVMVGNRGESGIGWQLRRRDSNKFCFTTRGVGEDDLGSGMNAPLNEWVHIAAVYDNAGNTKRIYVNGVQDALVATTAGKVAATTHNTYIGARANSGNTGREGFFTGLLDDLRIYTRALSAGEVEFLSDPRP